MKEMSSTAAINSTMAVDMFEGLFRSLMFQAKVIYSQLALQRIYF